MSKIKSNDANTPFPNNQRNGKSKVRPPITIAAALLLFVIVIAIFYLRTIPVAYVSNCQKETALDVVNGLITIQEHHSVKIRNERRGMVISSHFEIGDSVKRNDLLLKLDSEVYDIDLNYLLAEHEILKKIKELPKPSSTLLRTQQGKVKATERYLAQGKATREQLKNTKRNLASLESEIEREELVLDYEAKVRQNTIEKMRYNVERMKILSPIDGIITQTYARVGDLVDQSQVLYEIMGEEKRVVARINQEDFDRVEFGLPVKVYLKAFPDQVFTGTVGEKLPLANYQEEYFEAFINLDKGLDRVIPGLTGEIDIILDEHPNAITVPTQSVINNYVLKIEGSRINKTEVVTGFRNMLTTEIVEGLEEGEAVVSERTDYFEDGQLVRKKWELPR